MRSRSVPSRIESRLKSPRSTRLIIFVERDCVFVTRKERVQVGQLVADVDIYLDVRWHVQRRLAEDAETVLAKCGPTPSQV